MQIKETLANPHILNAVLTYYDFDCIDSPSRNYIEKKASKIKKTKEESVSRLHSRVTCWEWNYNSQFIVRRNLEEMASLQ